MANLMHVALAGEYEAALDEIRKAILELEQLWEDDPDFDRQFELEQLMNRIDLALVKVYR